MQKLGKSDLIILTHVGSRGQLLHRTQAGYQFGTGNDTQIVESLDQLEEFDERVKQEVAAWLNRGGVKAAKEARHNIEVSEAASEAPGTLDALADKLGPDIKAALYNLLTKGITSGGSLPAAISGAVAQEEDDAGNVLIRRPGQPTELIPSHSINGMEDEPELVGVGAGAEDDSFAAQLEESKDDLPRRGRPKKK